MIFQTPLWLDSVAGSNNWDVLLSFQGNLLCGVMPYVTSSKFGLKQITLPFLTPYLGPIIIFPDDLKIQNQLSFKRKIVKHLISQIPKNDRFITQTDFRFDFWLPFYWKGYQQTTRYSYILDTSPDIKELTKGYKPNIRKHIKRAREQFSITESERIDALYEMHQNDLKLKGESILFSQEQLNNLDHQIKTSGHRKILHAIDAQNNIVGAFYLVFDKTYTHYLIGAAQPNARSSGVMSLLMDEAILEAKKRDLTFNFEGSMHENIGRFFSSFGGIPTPYMQISKTSNKWLKEFTRFNHS